MPALTGTQLLFTLDLQHRSPPSKPVLYPLEQQTFSKQLDRSKRTNMVKTSAARRGGQYFSEYGAVLQTVFITAGPHNQWGMSD